MMCAILNAQVFETPAVERQLGDDEPLLEAKASVMARPHCKPIPCIALLSDLPYSFNLVGALRSGQLPKQ